MSSFYLFRSIVLFVIVLFILPPVHQSNNVICNYKPKPPATSSGQFWHFPITLLAYVTGGEWKHAASSTNHSYLSA